MTIIEYINNRDISIQFEDGVIVKHRSYSGFKNGTIKHPIRYEESIGYYIEKELKLNINDIWNWDKNNKNGINPYETPKQSNKKFDSIREAEEYFNMGRSNISRCCKGEREYAGKLKDGTKLKWMYYEDYIKGCEEINE